MNNLRWKFVNRERNTGQHKVSTLTTLFSRGLEVLAMAIREERKGIHIENEVKLSLSSDNMVQHIENPRGHQKTTKGHQ